MEALVKSAMEAEIGGLFPETSRDNIERVRDAGTTAISFRVLSPLAEGADRVVVKAVLAEPDARLDVVLPMTLEDYLEDFATEESRSEFEEFLRKCRNPVSLRSRRIRDDRHDLGDQAEVRRDAYSKVGEFVVDHCDVLIAIWDGEASRGRGGTAETVQYALEQKRPVIRVWGESYELLNRESSNGLDASALKGIDQFNRLFVAPDEKARYIKNLDKSYFEEPNSAYEVPANVREIVNDCLFPHYVRASIMAKRSRDQFHRTGKNIYVCSAAAVAFAAAAVLIAPIAKQKWGLTVSLMIEGMGFLIELMLLIFMLWTLNQARRKQSHQNWIENRFLAERIRCGAFMAICGVEPSPIQVLPYMGHSQTVNDWTVRVFEEIWDRLPRLRRCTEEDCKLLNPYIREVWIGKQMRFHEDKKKLESHARKRFEWLGASVLKMTIAAAVLHILLLFWVAKDPDSSKQLYEGFHVLFSFCALLLPAVAASLAGAEAHREHLRLEKRSANMVPQLERLDRQMASATDPERFENLLQQVDEIMLRETQDWLMLMRYVEIKAS
ncbi:hypothetical protein P8935_05115 [Telmatobacter sp. DSM 110680]|uniref:SMODS and SLOG-associating 2TM effector domain-containing protein n=1 Tax=Telmatobacter sp. DSM 110680 TaxID=3036704 RepID=A0AAU7DNP7_9BACT